MSHDRSQDSDAEGTPQALADLVLRNRAAIVATAAAFGASNVRLFGSASRGSATSHSDVDLLVDMELGRTLFDLAALRADLEELLGTTVDVIPAAGLEGEARVRILGEALPL